MIVDVKRINQYDLFNTISDEDYHYLKISNNINNHD